MNWNKNYVRDKYSFKMLGQEGIFYEAQNSKRLLILFSSMNKDSYDRYSWFWDENEEWKDTSFLFIKDDTFHYYLGDDEKPLTQTFRKIINCFKEKCNLLDHQIFTIGSSMGGYAAIYYASLMQLGGAIVANPQITYKSTRQHSYSSWERCIREVGTQWYDLDDFIKKSPIPNIYIEYGNYPADKSAAECLIKAVYSYNGSIIVKKTKWEKHTVSCLFKETILNTVEYFEKSIKVNSKYNS